MTAFRSPREILEDAVYDAKRDDPDVRGAFDDILRMEREVESVRAMLCEKRKEIKRLEKIIMEFPKQITVNVGQERPKDEARPEE